MLFDTLVFADRLWTLWRPVLAVVIVHGWRRLHRTVPVFAGLVVGVGGLPPADAAPPPVPAIEGVAPAIDSTAWINSPPVTPASLKGKVTVVSFWTYSCINCLRTLPALRAWSQRYAGRDVVVIGVHTPEFAFEKDTGNVTKAVRDLKITYPVVQDNDFRLWRAFDNRYWPAIYVVDGQGRIRHHQFGEGGQAATEAAIEALLREAGGRPADPSVSATTPADGIGLAPDGRDLRSPENYVGYAQAEGFVSPGGFVRDRNVRYEPGRPGLNEWSLSGMWAVMSEYAELGDAAGSIVYRFHARDLHLVMGTPPAGTPVRFVVTIDGHAPGADHGLDVDAEGRGIVGATRLYQLVRQRGPVDDRVVEVRFLGPGARAYAFTFG